MFDALQALRAADFGRRGRYLDLPLMRASARRADLVFTISEKAATDVQRSFGIHDDRLVVVLPGVDTSRFRCRPAEDPDALRAQLGFGSEPLLLFVGKHSRRRNVPTIIEAAGIARARGLPHRLVLVGPNQLDLPLEDIARRTGALVTHLADIDDTTLVDLYNMSDVFVQLPEDEPFSLPLLEAMACGTPVITLDGPALREIGGDAVSYVPAADAGLLANALEELAGDAERRSQLATAGLHRAARFSWRSVADSLAMGLRYVAGAGPRPPRRQLEGAS
jgi:glycosyltransferase involved in cell wall biosynthesis